MDSQTARYIEELEEKVDQLTCELGSALNDNDDLRGQLAELELAAIASPRPVTRRVRPLNPAAWTATSVKLAGSEIELPERSMS